MKILKVIGGEKLSGSIRISGAKNSAVALIPASLLGKKATICNIPDISDIDILVDTLEYLNVSVKRASGSIVIDTSGIENKDIPESLTSKLRASYYFMSVLLAKYKYVKMPSPGGCQIGSRPIDQTLKAFRLLGAEVKEENGFFVISAKELIGNKIPLDMPSVGATVNAILVAVFAKGQTIIENAACEPEIEDLANFLNKMGAKIKGAGTSNIEINGVLELNECNHDVISDRIEAGTYTIIGALVGNYLKIDNINPLHIKSLTDKLEEMGAELDIHEDYLIINKTLLTCTDIETKGYPGFPTDLQQPMVTLLTNAKGVSNITENIYENRFNNILYLNKMGASIHFEGRIASITGPTKLSGREVKATDLRAGASLLVASLVAEGETIITDVEHILRGYEKIVEKLTNVGAKIEIKEI